MPADIGKALTYQVSHDSGVTALLGSNPIRFTPTSLPQTPTLPHVVWQDISGTLTQHHGEASILPRHRIQVTCWGASYADVVAVDKAIKTALDGKRGDWGTGTYVTRVESCQAETTPRGDRDPETQMYQRSRDYIIMWKE